VNDQGHQVSPPSSFSVDRFREVRAGCFKGWITFVPATELTNSLTIPGRSTIGVGCLPDLSQFSARIPLLRLGHGQLLGHVVVGQGLLPTLGDASLPLSACRG